MGFGLAAWMANLKRRVDFMKLWLLGQPPQPFWLPGCFSPRSVCTAMLQHFARRNNLKIDAVGFNFHVIDEGDDTLNEDSSAQKRRGEGLSTGFAHDVSGLFLHGASWSLEEKVRMLCEIQTDSASICTSDFHRVCFASFSALTAKITFAPHSARPLKITWAAFSISPVDRTVARVVKHQQKKGRIIFQEGCIWQLCSLFFGKGSIPLLQFLLSHAF